MNSKLFLLFLLLACQICAASQTELGRKKVNICIDETEYPPLNYFIRLDGRKTSVNAGFDIELLRLVLSRQDWRVNLVAAPWPRCLLEVEQGRLDAAMASSANDERRATFLLSRPYFYLSPSVAFLPERFPQLKQEGLPQRLDSLGRVCGIRGFNYAYYEQPADLGIHRSNEILQFSDLLLKRRCEFFLINREVYSAILRLEGQESLADRLAILPMAGGIKVPFYMLVSRRSPHAQALLSEFNRGVDSLEQSGALARLWTRFTEGQGGKTNP
ncbi:substrate-binding periplasmic protein [Shewanella halotolerans]|uniref:substrate-binding periplasmic protein n=1 Tax=Shewanella halotolerans TaxID=2864204 RepID=UPI001C65D779|nr:transporter substrate-binding domain-containing protein [Shewanella halotolerans]QYJ89853.1 transporter substrate-binding domain-containing protein [Shewanella halotolerans]